jgi:peptidoglycan hydrolase CwlO-like protein
VSGSKRTTLFTIGGVFLGIIGTAFSMGANKQRINDTLIQHTTQMVAMAQADKDHEGTTQKELDRFAQIIASQMILLQDGISQINSKVGELQGNVKVLQALMERVENDIKKSS